MGIKEIIRPLLPPTSRAFSRRADNLAETLRRIDEVQGSLSGLAGPGFEEVRAIAGSLRYVNMEYLAKLAQSTTDILVAGWYGAENFGDELMLRTLLDYLPDDSLSRVAVMLWDNFYYPIDRIDPRVTILHYPRSTWELQQLADHFSVLVWGGGAIVDDKQFDDDPYNLNTGNLFIRLSKLMLARGKRVYSLALSTNDSISDRRYISELDDIVQKSSLFSVRDPLSLNCLELSGINIGHICICEDIAFANRELTKLPKHAATGYGLLQRIALVPLTTSNLRPHYQSVLKALLETMPADASESEVRLVPFLNGSQGHDVRYCEELANSLGDERIIVESFAYSPQELHFERCDCVIAYKYHAALISLLQEVPTVCVYDGSHPHYRNKMTHLANLFESEGSLFSVLEFEGKVSGLSDGLASLCRAPQPCGPLLENEAAWLEGVCEEIVSN